MIFFFRLVDASPALLSLAAGTLMVASLFIADRAPHSMGGTQHVDLDGRVPADHGAVGHGDLEGHGIRPRARRDRDGVGGGAPRVAGLPPACSHNHV